MKKTSVTNRRALAAMFAALACGGAVASAVDAPSATAGQDPCAASQVARTIGMVATSTGTYLDAHPETNQALTAISQQQPGPQTLGSLKSYFDAHPQEGTVMQQLQQPLVSLTTQCKLPLTLPQVMGLMQATQGGGLAGALPGAAAAALPGGVPGAGSVPSVPAATPSTGTGSTPGFSAGSLPGVTVGGGLPGMATSPTTSPTGTLPPPASSMVSGIQ